MLTDELYESVKDIWKGYHEHPFVNGIGDGSLPIEKFRFYMLQDYLYLYDYAKVFALGVVKSTEPSMIRRFSYFVEDTLGGEMDIHSGYMERLGITDEEVPGRQRALQMRPIQAICWKWDSGGMNWISWSPFCPVPGVMRRLAENWPKNIRMQ